MPNALVKAALHYASATELGIVELKSTQDKADQPEQEDQRADTWENFGREVRQKEGWQPCRSWEVERPREQRPVDRVIVEREGSDHEEHFQRDEQVRKKSSRPCERVKHFVFSPPCSLAIVSPVR